MPGEVGPGAAWQGEENEMGDWQASRFEPSTPTQRGQVGRGKEGQGEVRFGDARPGSVWLDMAGSGAARPGVAGEWRADGLWRGSTPRRPRTRLGAAWLG